MDGTVLYLPHEIIRNILKRLRVKSLVRFQCVCKDWKNLIQNPSFIADHLRQSTHQNPSLLLEWNILYFDFRRVLSLMDCGLHVREVQNSPSSHSMKNARIVGSCNGLLCLKFHQSNQPHHSLALWNPATTALRHVPRSRTDLSDFDDYVTGFGFSPIVNDYKIVRTYANDSEAVALVEVFSLSTGTWKARDIGSLKRVRLNSETVTANGAIFWSGAKLVGEEEKEDEDNIEFQEDEDYMEETEDEDEVIVSFDIAEEVFTVIPFPELDNDDAYKLTVYENKLAILNDIWEDDDTDEIPFVIDLWALDEGTCASGDTWSRTRRYTIGPLECSIHSMTIWRNEIVCKPDFEEYADKERIFLFMMNLTTNEIKLKMLRVPGRYSFLSIYNYVESLILFGNNHIADLHC